MPRNGALKKIIVTAAASVLAASAIGTGSAFLAYGNRITALETGRDDIKDRLDRIEKKVDRLLFRRGPNE